MALKILACIHDGWLWHKVRGMQQHGLTLVLSGAATRDVRTLSNAQVIWENLAGVLISAPRGLASILDAFPLLAKLGLQGCR